MKEKILAATISAVMLISLISVFQVTPVSASPPATFTILFTNDSHARMEPLPRIATLVEEIRAEEVDFLLLDAGDAFLGDPVANFFDGWPIVEIMNLLGYDAMELGNHEFDHGQDVLCDLAGEADFPLLAANLRWKDDPNQIPSWATGYVIEEVGGVKVAIFGLITEDLPVVAHPLHVENLLVLDPIGVAENYVLLLEKADIIIALTHLGLDIDMKLATEVEGIDVIVGGHSHDTLLEPVVVENTIIVQAGEYYEYLGRLDLEIEGDSIVGFSYELIPTEGVAEDPETKAIVDSYYEELEEIFAEVVGVTSVPLDGSRKPFGVRNRETNLGDLVADSILWYLEPWDVDIAVQNGGGIRWHRWFPAGEITLGDVYELLPFPNVMVASTLPGENIWKALERSVGEFPNEFGGFLHIAGLKFSFDPSKPAGNRVENVWVDGEPLDNAKTYRVGMNDFTAAGGDGYVELMGGDNFAYTGVLYIEPFRTYLENLGTVDPTCDGRITALGYLDAGEVRTHKTIQEAINAAHPGDTVLVDPGTYEENINIDKSLTVRSVEGAEVTIINAQEAQMGVLINGAGTVATFEGFTVENYDTVGILAGAFSPTWGPVPDEVHILNNIVYEPRIEPPHNNCIQVGNGTTGTIIGNEVSGALLEDPDWTGSGILVAGSSNVLVSNNYAHDCESGIVVADYKYWVAPADNNLVENNMVESNETGISVQGNSIGTIIRYNDVLNNDVGIGSMAYYGTPSDTEVHYNNIVGNGYGVESMIWEDTAVAAEQVDATLNWWGDPTGPNNPTTNPSATGDDVSDNVDYTPWLDAPYLTGVARSWNVQNVDTGENFNSIQAAIDAAELGDTVLVHPGTYEEYILINKPLTVKSTDGAEKTIIDGIGFRYMIRIYSSDVTFEGFTVTNPTYEGGADASGILIGAYLGESVDNVNILNNIVKAVRSGTTGAPSMYGATGINIGRGPLSNVVISGNTIENIHNPEGASIDHTCGINVWDGAENVLISNNAISDIKYNGIMLECASNVQIENNSITECETGIRVEPYEGATVSDLTIHLNTFENNGKQLIDASGDLDIAEILANNTFDRAVIVETASYLPFIWSSIQDAIDNASLGDTVLVYPGTYYQNLVIDRSLTLQGEDRETTIIQSTLDGCMFRTYGDRVIIVESSDVTVTGFTISGYTGTEEKRGSTSWGIYADDFSNIEVTNNIFTFYTQGGIQFLDVENSVISGNIFKRETRIVWYDPPGVEPGSYIEGTRGGSGPALWRGANCVIYNNTVSTYAVGIFLYGTEGTLVENNLVSAPDTEKPSDSGIHIQSCGDTTIRGNVVENFIAGPTKYYNYGKTGAGIRMLGGTNCNVEKNTLTNNTVGVLVTGATEGCGNNINWNNIDGNTEFGVLNCATWIGETKTYTPATATIDATLNYWGHPSGPGRDKGKGNPGRGDRVSENVRYHPWLTKPFQTVLEKHVGHYGFEGPCLEKGWNTLSVPIYLDNNAWEEIAAYLDENIAYRFNASTQAWELMTTDSKLDPLDAIYIRMNSEDSVPLVVSVSITNPPVKELKRGWNLIGLAVWEEENMSVDRALVSVELTPDGKRGYTIVVSPSLNQEPWIYTIVDQTEKPLMNKNKAYWVYMENPGNLAGFSITPLPFWEPE